MEAHPHTELIRTLLVDDHEVLRLGLVDLVNNIVGFRVTAQADSCGTAKARLAAQPIDLVLLDLSLSDAQGIATVHQLQQYAPQVPIIILSSSLDDDVLLQALLAGVCGYLTKDTPAHEIARALQAYRRGELALLPPVMARALQLALLQYTQLNVELALSQEKQRELEFQLQRLLRDEQDGATAVVQPAGAVALESLTPQEEKVYHLMRQGLSNKQIARHLIISHYTVGKHVQNILHKLGVTNRTQAVSYTSFEGVKDQ